MITQIIWFITWPVSVVLVYYITKWALRKSGLYQNKSSQQK